jgi:hypothetical protein
MITRIIMWAWRKKPPSKWLFLIAILISSSLLFVFLGAIFGADKLPKLRGQILMVNVGDMKYTSVLTPKAALQDAGFVELVVGISNTGAPSIATDYAMTVTFPRGARKTAQAIAIPPEGTKIPHKDSGTSETIHREDHLPRKTIQPIPKGGSVQGLLLFLVEGASMQDLKAIGTSFRIEFKDLWGREYSAEIQNTGMNDTMLDWPGVNSEVTYESELETKQPSPSPTPHKAASPH